VKTQAASRPWEIHAALAGAQVGFALFPILGKLVLVSVPPLLFAAFRAVAAAALLEAFRRAQKNPEAVRRADVPRLVLYGLLGVTFNQILFIDWDDEHEAFNTTVLTTTIPSSRSPRPRPRAGTPDRPRRGRDRLAGGGALLLLNAQRFDWSSASFRGDLLLIANCISYSLFLVLSRPSGALPFRDLHRRRVPLRRRADRAPRAAGARAVRARPRQPLGWASLAGVILLCTVIPYLLNAGARARSRLPRRVLRLPAAVRGDDPRDPDPRRELSGKTVLAL
jgi:hypothetical protein